MDINNNITELCILGYRYGTDKTPLIKHAYTPFYHDLMSRKRKSTKKVLEFGVGHYNDMQKEEVIYDPGLKRYMHRGASLYMWRDFFPNALIFGADNRPETIFEDTRLKTYLADETKTEDIKELIKKTGNDIDFIVDDASHHVDDQIFLVKNLMPLLQKTAVYAIEDVSHCNKICRALENDYECQVPEIFKTWSGGRIVVVRNKKNGKE